MIPYSSSDNLASPISRVLIIRHLILCSLTSPTCCNSPRKCTPVKYKARQKAGFPIITYTTSHILRKRKFDALDFLIPSLLFS